MAELLVSVRSVEEAEAALAGGAALIDVKEPSFGPLGRAAPTTVAAVIRAIAGRWPVSAAFGELVEAPRALPLLGLTFAKWGLAGCGRQSRWQEELAAAAASLQETTPGCRLVAVAYADWQRAQAPPPDEVCAFACQQGTGAFLLDTWGKDGTTLLDWISPAIVCQFAARCREAGVRVALAGSLGVEQFRLLLAANPDWFAVRGAACCEGRRGDVISLDRVRSLSDFLRRSLLPELRAALALESRL
jgi:uncharacterized protein (UPF0264 family)